jgi:hypothetical protein
MSFEEADFRIAEERAQGGGPGTVEHSPRKAEKLGGFSLFCLPLNRTIGMAPEAIYPHNT